jgi:hypothetical protein
MLCNVHTLNALYFLFSHNSLSLTGDAIRCFQCSSGQDPKGEDNCGAYDTFEKQNHIAVDCNSDESHTPGTFCLKKTQQGPIGFVCKY